MCRNLPEQGSPWNKKMKQQISYYQVLLVDDEYYVRKGLLRRFDPVQGDDFRVIAEAENGEEALAMIKKHAIQLVITDIRMPVMDGLELTSRIHREYPDLLVVILTGYPDFEYAQKALRYGAFDYLVKPVSEEALESLLTRVRTRLSEKYELPEEEGLARSGEECVRMAIRYMREHYMENIDISVLAADLGFHSSYLTRLFGKYVGVTPLKYLTNLRIEEAQRLLLDTDLTIGEVGERVGYPDQFHFSKTFRKATGVNPSAYRKAEKTPG